MDTKDAGRIGGKSKSEAKQRASRENGKKGGRPRLLRTVRRTTKERRVLDLQ